MKLPWKCECKEQVIVSDTKKYDILDYCKCGKSCVDAEDDMTRVISGDVKFLDNCVGCGVEVFEDDLSKDGLCEKCEREDKTVKLLT